MSPAYGGYLQGQRSQMQNQAAQLDLQNAQDLRRASLASMLDNSGVDPTTATIMALSGQPVPQSPPGGATPSMTPTLPSAQQQPTATPTTPMGGAAPSAGDIPAGPGGTTPAPAMGPTITPTAPAPAMRPAAMPAFGGAQMSLGQMFQRLRADPRNRDIPDTTLFGLAAKAQQSLLAPDRQLLGIMSRFMTTPYQQEELGLRREQIAGAREDRAATNALRLQLAQLGMDKAQAGKWQVLTDANGTNFRYNAETGQATTLDGRQQYSPQGTATKIGSGQQPRSAPAMALKKFMDEHPNATAEDVANFGAEYQQRVKAARDFGTGPLGNSIRSINTAVQHLDTAREAGEALANNDTRALNALKNRFAQEFGSPLPTNFDAIKQIVGQEVVKAIVAGGGGVSERQEAQNILSRASSPAQLAGAIQQIQTLMAGQLNSLRKQYQETTKLDDFDKRFLMPHTLDAMKRAGYDTQSAGGEDTSSKGGGGSAANDPLGIR